MMKLRPRYLLVFAVTGKEKYKGFYTPQIGKYADYFELMEVWIADMGADCRCVSEGVGLGSRCYLLDVYELDNQVPFKIMQQYGEVVDFGDDILKVAKDTGGQIEAFVIHENSLIGVEECQQKPLKLSWDNQTLASPTSEEICSEFTYPQSLS